MVGAARRWAVVAATLVSMLAAVASPAPAQAGPTLLASRAVGYDVSWPNCGTRLPDVRFGVIGVTGGLPFSTNPCLAAEFTAARRTLSAQLYMNIAAPGGPTAGRGRSGPAGTCSTRQVLCRAYNYGYNAARAAYVYAAHSLGSRATRTAWWLDVELGMRWSASTSVNARSVAGALAYLRSRHLAVGVYSTTYQWQTLVGTYRPGVPVWYATVNRAAAAARRHCTSGSAFTGGAVRMVQYAPGGLDTDVVC